MEIIELIKYSMQLRTFTKSEMILFFPIFRWLLDSHQIESIAIL